MTASRGAVPAVAPGTASPRPAGGRAVRSLVAVIGLYRTMISPLRPPACRFTPTCSQYAVSALTEYGLLRGTLLSLIRLAKCGPWHRGGWDPVPDRPAHGSPSAPRRADV